MLITHPAQQPTNGARMLSSLLKGLVMCPESSGRFLMTYQAFAVRNSPMLLRLLLADSRRRTSADISLDRDSHRAAANAPVAFLRDTRACLAETVAGAACSLTPRARTTLRIVAKLGLPSPESAL